MFGCDIFRSLVEVIQAILSWSFQTMGQYNGVEAKKFNRKKNLLTFCLCVALNLVNTISYITHIMQHKNNQKTSQEHWMCYYQISHLLWEYGSQSNLYAVHIYNHVLFMIYACSLKVKLNYCMSK